LADDLSALLLTPCLAGLLAAGGLISPSPLHAEQERCSKCVKRERMTGSRAICAAEDHLKLAVVVDLCLYA
jgi:hypothetical protein